MFKINNKDTRFAGPNLLMYKRWNNILCNYWQMYKSLREIIVHKKQLRSKVVLPKKSISSLLVSMFNHREPFFSEYSFLYFTKVVAAIYSLMDTEWIRYFYKSTCSHELHIYNVFDRSFYLSRIAISKERLQL